VIWRKDKRQWCDTLAKMWQVNLTWLAMNGHFHHSLSCFFFGNFWPFEIFWNFFLLFQTCYRKNTVVKTKRMVYVFQHLGGGGKDGIFPSFLIWRHPLTSLAPSTILFASFNGVCSPCVAKILFWVYIYVKLFLWCKAKRSSSIIFYFINTRT